MYMQHNTLQILFIIYHINKSQVYKILYVICHSFQVYKRTNQRQVKRKTNWALVQVYIVLIKLI